MSRLDCGTCAGLPEGRGARPNHGLPQPFDELGRNRMLDNVGCTEFFDGTINAVHR